MENITNVKHKKKYHKYKNKYKFKGGSVHSIFAVVLILILILILILVGSLYSEEVKKIIKDFIDKNKKLYELNFSKKNVGEGEI